MELDRLVPGLGMAIPHLGGSDNVGEQEGFRYRDRPIDPPQLRKRLIGSGLRQDFSRFRRRVLVGFAGRCSYDKVFSQGARKNPVGIGGLGQSDGGVTLTVITQSPLARFMSYIATKASGSGS